VQVKVAATQDQPSKIAVFKVGIMDKIIDTLGGMIGVVFDVGGDLLCKGIKVSKDDTFAAINVLQNDKFL